MRKPPRKPRRPNRTPPKPSARQATATTEPLPKYHPSFVAAITAELAASAEAVASGTAEADSELMQQCDLVNQKSSTLDADAWGRALLRVGARSPATLAGLRAKLEVTIRLIPYPLSKAEAAASRAALDASSAMDEQEPTSGTSSQPDPLAAFAEAGSLSDMIIWFTLYDVLDLVEQALAGERAG